jgi:hypothetical protein
MKMHFFHGKGYIGPFVQGNTTILKIRTWQKRTTLGIDID